jgi:hypothetical protein
MNLMHAPGDFSAHFRVTGFALLCVDSTRKPIDDAALLKFISAPRAAAGIWEPDLGPPINSNAPAVRRSNAARRRPCDNRLASQF